MLVTGILFGVGYMLIGILLCCAADKRWRGLVTDFIGESDFTGFSVLAAWPLALPAIRWVWVYMPWTRGKTRF